MPNKILKIFCYEGDLRAWEYLSGKEYRAVKGENDLPIKAMRQDKNLFEVEFELRKLAEEKGWDGFVNVTWSPIKNLPSNLVRSGLTDGFQVTGYPVKLVVDGQGLELYSENVSDLGLDPKS